MNTGIDRLVIGNYLLRKEDQPSTNEWLASSARLGTIDEHSYPTYRNAENPLFGFIFSLLIVLIFGPPALAFNQPMHMWPWVVCTTALLLARARYLRPLHSLFIKLGTLLAFINTRILLFIIFFGLFLPVSIVMWLAKRDILGRKPSTVDSYRKSSQPRPRDHFERPY